ncbi:MAG: hypothetical protein WA030_01520 [Candidatus Microsaccharimonas sp.]
MAKNTQTPNPEGLRALKPRLEESLRVDSRVVIDMNRDLVEKYGEKAEIRTDKFTGEMVADIEVGDLEKDGSLFGIFRGEKRTGQPFTFMTDGQHFSVIPVGEPTDFGTGFALTIGEDLSRLTLDKSGDAEVRVSGYVVPGRQAFERP